VLLAWCCRRLDAVAGVPAAGVVDPASGGARVRVSVVAVDHVEVPDGAAGELDERFWEDSSAAAFGQGRFGDAEHVRDFGDTAERDRLLLAWPAGHRSTNVA